VTAIELQMLADCNLASINPLAAPGKVSSDGFSAEPAFSVAQPIRGW
jgi:hypothetical protein